MYDQSGHLIANLARRCILNVLLRRAPYTIIMHLLKAYTRTATTDIDNCTELKYDA